MWVFKGELSRKTDPHTSQGNGLTPVYIYMRLFKYVNADPHSLNENGSFPKCIL